MTKIEEEIQLTLSTEEYFVAMQEEMNTRDKEISVEIEFARWFGPREKSLKIIYIKRLKENEVNACTMGFVIWTRFHFFVMKYNQLMNVTLVKEMNEILQP